MELRYLTCAMHFEQISLLEAVWNKLPQLT